MTDNFLSMKPEVWALNSYPAGGGGANAFNGVAKLFAERTGLELRVLELQPTIAAYKQALAIVTERLPAKLRGQPEAASRTWWRRNRAVKEVAGEVFYCEQGGLPSAVLTTFMPYFTSHRLHASNEDTIRTPRSVFVANSLDIMSWNAFLPDGYEGLAPHSLTEEILKTEAARYHKRLKGDGRELVGIVVGDSGYYSGSDMEKALVALAASMPEARFVLSSSPRCQSGSFTDFCNEFRAHLNPQQLQNLVTFDFHKDRKYENPYKALLTLADHMIILGQSESMVSDRLFAGRTAYYGYGYSDETISKAFGKEIVNGKLVKHFPATPLVSETFPSVNSTSLIVDNLITRYQENRTAVASAEQDPDPAFDAMKRKIHRAVAPAMAAS